MLIRFIMVMVEERILHQLRSVELEKTQTNQVPSQGKLIQLESKTKREVERKLRYLQNALLLLLDLLIS